MKHDQRYYLSICCIARNEGLYIAEWIEFHLIQGVEHFYIYENGSDDDTLEVLERYRDVITLTQVPYVEGVNAQRPAYEDFLRSYGHETKWCAVLDCDEFLYAPNGPLQGPLRLILQQNEGAGAVAVNWTFFGSSWEKSFKLGLVISRFTHSARHPDIHVKSIIQPELTISTGNNAHYFLLSRPAVDAAGKELPKEYHWSECSRLLCIAHFHTKSLEEYLRRKSKLDVDGVYRGITDNRFHAHDINEIHNRALYNYAPLIKRRMNDRLRKTMD